MLRVTVDQGEDFELKVPYPEGVDSTWGYLASAASANGELIAAVIPPGPGIPIPPGTIGLYPPRIESSYLVLNAPFTATGLWEPDEYTLQLRAQTGTPMTPDFKVLVFTVAKLVVKRSVFGPDPEDAFTTKTWRENVLAQAQAALLIASESGEIQFSVEGVSYSYESRRSLLQFIRSLEREIAVQRGRKRRPVIQMGL